MVLENKLNITDNYPAYGRILLKICAPGAHVLKVRSALPLDLQQHSTHSLNSFEGRLF